MRTPLVRFRIPAVAVVIGLSACQGQQEPPREVIEPAPPVVSRAPLAMVPDVESSAEEPPRPPLIERGTGTFIGQPPRVATVARTAGGEITINVVDADVRDVVRMILEDALGVNYVIDPSVQGTITVQTSEPVPGEDLVPVLDSVLRVNGAALVQSGDLYKVVPIEEAISSGATVGVYPLPEAGTPGFGVRVTPVRYVSAAEIAQLIGPFAPPGGEIQVDPSRNLLLLAGAFSDLDTLSNLVQMFDVDWLKGMSFGLFPVSSTRASQIALELEEVFGGPEVGPLAGVVRFVPIDRLNSVLVISARPEYLSRAETWIERLDESTDGDEEQIYVYAVQNGRAADLAAVLSEIFDTRSATVGRSDLLAPGLEPVQFGSSGFQIAEGGEAGAEAPAEPATPVPSTAGPTIERREASSEGDSLLQGEVRIIADETTNSLVIRAGPRDYRKIEAALEQLDILPLQVLIEATIAEVVLQDDLRYGVEWFFRFGDASVQFSRLTSGLVTGQFPGFSALFSNGDVRAVINALEEVTDINVISSPQLLVLDNQTARLQVGDQVPIATQSAVSVTDPDAPVVNTIEQRDTGVILSVTPRVNASGLVIMEIDEETSDVVETTTSDIDSPTIRQRRVASSVAVQSGQTVVLGGLIQDEGETRETGIPFLHRLPIIGALFGLKDNQRRRTELLVVITPRIVRNPEQARAVTEELRRRLQGLAPLDAKVR